MQNKIVSRVLALIITPAILIASTMTASAGAPVKASTGTAAVSSSGVDLRPVKVKSENGKLLISRDSGATWAESATQVSAKPVSLKDTDDDLAILQEGLEGLSSLSSIPGLNWAVKNIFDLIFPDNTSQNISNSLSDISSQLQAIQQMLQEDLNLITNQIVQSSLKTQINTFNQNAAPYQSAAQNLMSIVNGINNETDPVQKQKDMQYFLATTLPRSGVNNQNIVESAEAFGNYISGSTDILGLYDQTALYSYKWEHQGYEPRRAFQASVLSTYVALTTIAEMEIAQDSTDNSVIAQAEFVNLQKNISLAQTKSANETVVERPSYQRYYQVPGHECLLANKATSRQVLQYLNGNQFSGSVDDYISYWQNQQFSAMFTDNSLPYKNTNPTSAWLQQVYADYGGSAASASLWDIFFSQNEANISPDPGLSKGTQFISNDFLFTYKRSSSWLGGICCDNAVTKTTVVNDNSSSTQYNQQMAHGYDDDGNWVYYRDTTIPYIGLEVLNQGKTPVNFVPAPRATSTDPGGKSTDTKVIQNPRTGDNEPGSIEWVVVIVMIAGAMCFLLRKRNRTTE